MTEFDGLPQAKKGSLGEQIAAKWIREGGYIPYSPVFDGAHPVDWFCASPDKKRIFIADAKAKAARKYYPDTGINIRHHLEYLHLQNTYNMQVFLFFIDEISARIYGNFLKILDAPRVVTWRGQTYFYPLEQKGIRYFPLDAMRDIGRLTEEETESLRVLSTRNPAYEPTP